ncbi:MAG TPA: hypothetical protein DHW02_07015 [Ktedonobacter sp.]|nr:hypothetical protein [Ktedonobacter sp.]
MSSVPEINAHRPTPMPTPARSSTVVMGRQDFVSVVLRLTGVELYKLRRRAMSKILNIIALALISLIFLVISLGTIFVVNSPVQTFLPPQCSSLRSTSGQIPAGVSCLNHPPTQQDLAQAAKARQDNLQSISTPLRLPTSLYISVQFMVIVGLILLVIIAGTIVGGEYSSGTIRLMCTRGPSRIQFLLAKVGAIFAYTLLGLIVVVLLGVILSALLNLLSGIPMTFDFLQNGGGVAIVLYLMATFVSLFVYTMLALFLATFGRATVAGVAGPIVWYILEGILTSVFGAIGLFVKGPFGDLLKAVPDYFIGNNVNALLQNIESRFLGGQASTISDLHAWLVLLAYIILFIGVSLWITEHRDITN